MLKESITYKDYDGTEVTEELNFHMSQFELAEMAASIPDDIMADIDDPTDPEAFNHVIKHLGNKGLVAFTKLFIIKAFGVKEMKPNGKFTFKKSEKIAEDFTNSMAFHTFAMKVITDTSYQTNFFEAVIETSSN